MAAALTRHSVRSVVVDPVLVATSGHSLADSSTAVAIRHRLVYDASQIILIVLV